MSDDKKRTEAEASLARELLFTLLEQGRAFRAGSSSSEAGSKRRTTELTETESRIFGVRTYLNWTVGSLAGLGTFVVLFGGLRWNASRRALKYATAPARQMSRPQQHHFHGLEGGISKKSSIYQNQPSSVTLNSVLSDDVIAQIQFMCIGALSIVLSSVVARLAYNEEQFIRDLGDLPLQPGQSQLCYAVCPAVAEKLEAKLDTNNETAVDMQSLVNDPITVELESMMRFISNCKTRMDYERKHGGIPENPVNVPEPGVPLPYVSIDEKGEDQSVQRGWFNR
jgi:hypothetical protein